MLQGLQSRFVGLLIKRSLFGRRGDKCLTCSGRASSTEMSLIVNHTHIEASNNSHYTYTSTEEDAHRSCLARGIDPVILSCVVDRKEIISASTSL